MVHYNSSKLPIMIIIIIIIITGTILDFFVSEFISKLDEYYRPLNAALASQGFRPGIEDEIRARGSLLNTPDAGRRPESPAPEPEPEPEPVMQPPPAPPPDTEPADSEADDTLLGQAARLGEQSPVTPAGAERAQADQSRYESVVNALNMLRDNQSQDGTGSLSPENTIAPASLASALERLTS